MYPHGMSSGWGGGEMHGVCRLCEYARDYVVCGRGVERVFEECALMVFVTE